MTNRHRTATPAAVGRARGQALPRRRRDRIPVPARRQHGGNATRPGQGAVPRVTACPGQAAMDVGGTASAGSPVDRSTRQCAPHRGELRRTPAHTRRRRSRHRGQPGERGRRGRQPVTSRAPPADHCVERPAWLGEFAALGLLDPVAEPVADVLVAQVDQGGDAQDDGKPIEGTHSCTATVTLLRRPH